ncbi:DNA mismatch repair protein MlH1, putative [Entamoeba invadens IP1]|uniref:DNA mismatch repair protein MlH1, putative n=1 Tax=Entamoeba invadens IP1 TaxID=370355 RepID=UPI0002C3E972|nr:DNA mismatch repair protein MlH1, putative [Entamoeba invadens IP1]ELP93405.1 DNA mismatch repair protein MlH1, putative [Entamoeba invadens IP1]|eukprot:XP_004260176.1 DNA mismatch repair protein MlH1, putative [Entamoeba invadens IP1]
MAQIRRLDTTTINKIGAGEVIQRPYNVVKELIENSIDAKATTINVSVKQGGLSQISVIDNGIGFSPEDLKMVGERYMTSKNIGGDTYGYRGEALSCMTYLAKVTITTRQAMSEVAYKVVISDGKIQGDIQPTAGEVGTIVIVEDLFKNMPRKRGMKEGEEYSRIIEVVGNYAIHNALISFTLRKSGTASCDIKTNNKSTILANISKIHTIRTAETLHQFSKQNEEPPFSMDLFLSDSGYDGKKNIFILFINNRYVEFPALKKIFERSYEENIPKVSHFVYMSVEVEKERIDANVNPSKTAVRLLEEEKVLSAIDKFINVNLAQLGQVKTFFPTQAKTQPLQIKLSQRFPSRVDATASTITSFLNDDRIEVLKKTRRDKSGILFDKNEMDEDNEKTGVDIQKELDEYNHERKKENEDVGMSASELQQLREKEKMPETAEEKLERKKTEKQQKSKKKTTMSKLDNSVDTAILQRRPSGYVRSGLKSVEELRREFEEEQSAVNMLMIVKDMVYVGIVNQEFFLAQSGGSLYLVHTSSVICEMVYQQMIYTIGSGSMLVIEPEVSIKELLKMTRKVGYSEEEENVKEDELIEQIVKHKDMMKNYFKIHINERGQITGMPDVMGGYSPNAYGLTFFVNKLRDIDWKEEKKCLGEIARAVGWFYSVVGGDETVEQLSMKIEHNILPYIKKMLVPQKVMMNTTLTQIVDVAKLYHVFERC